jgi:hypothetical protein
LAFFAPFLRWIFAALHPQVFNARPFARGNDTESRRRTKWPYSDAPVATMLIGIAQDEHSESACHHTHAKAGYGDVTPPIARRIAIQFVPLGGYGQRSHDLVSEPLALLFRWLALFDTGEGCIRRFAFGWRAGPFGEGFEFLRPRHDIVYG